jgi:hypothetical protein
MPRSVDELLDDPAVNLLGATWADAESSIWDQALSSIWEALDA